jgi:hypothetical protein
MWLTFSTTLALLAVSGSIYVVLHRRLGWVELWNPLAPTPPQGFASLLPLEDVQNQCYICTDGSLVAGWELTGIDADMRDPTAVEHEVNALGLALNLIDPGVEAIVQVRRSEDVSMLLTRFDAVSTPRTPERLWLKRRWRAQLERIAAGGAFLDTRVYVFLRAGGDKRGANPLRLLVDAVKSAVGARGNFDPAKEASALRNDYARRLYFLEEKSRAAMSVLGSSPFQPRRLSNVELVQYAKSLLWSAASLAHGGGQPRRPEPNRFLLRDTDRPTRRWMAKVVSLDDAFPCTLRAQIAGVPYEPFTDYVALDGRLIGVMRLMIAPDRVYNGLLSHMRQQLQFPWTFTARITPRQKQAELDRLRKVAERSAITANTKPAGTSQLDSGNIKNAEEAQRRYDDALDPSQSLFGVEITVTYEAANREELLRRASDLNAYWLGIGDARLIREEYGADRVFRETLPFGIPRRTAQMVLFTAEVSALLPVFTPWAGSQEPVRVFRTVTGEPWGFDPVDRHLSGAQHAMGVGKTGSGKGVIWQLMVIYPALLKGDCDICILDSGGTYRRAAQVLGGTYFEASASSREALNVCAIPAAYYRLPPDQQQEFLSAHIQTAVGVATTLAKPRPEQQPTWEAILSAILTRRLRQSAVDREEVLLRHVVQEVREYQNPDNPKAEAEAQQLCLQLEGFTHDEQGLPRGQYATLFDRPQTFDAGNADFLVVDFNKVGNDPTVLGAFVLMSIAGIFWQRILRNATSGTGRYTRVIFDETPKYLQMPLFGKEVARAYREFRKFSGIADVIAQSWADTALEQFKAVLGPIKENSTTRLFLAHDRSHLATQTLKEDGLEVLDPKIFELGRKDGVYSEAVVSQKTGLTTQYAHVVIAPDAIENWLATTNPEDLHVETAYRRRFGEGTHWNLTTFEQVAVLAAIWPNGTKNQAMLTGVGIDRFPPDTFVRGIVEQLRAELRQCAATLVEQGLSASTPPAAAESESRPNTPPTDEPALREVPASVGGRDARDVVPISVAAPRTARSLSELRARGRF